MSLGAGILDPTDPGLYRVQRGRQGADQLMVPDVGVGGRYVITTGDAEMVNGGIAALSNDWRRVFDPRSPSFALLFLGVLLFVILGRLNLSGTVSAGARAGVK
jgi:hypothetical protein